MQIGEDVSSEKLVFANPLETCREIEGVGSRGAAVWRHLAPIGARVLFRGAVAFSQKVRFYDEETVILENHEHRPD